MPLFFLFWKTVLCQCKGDSVIALCKVVKINLLNRWKTERITDTLTKWEIYGRWSSFWFSNSSKVTGKAADLPASTYSKSRSILYVALWPLYSSWTKTWHLLPTLDVHCKSDHRMREQMVSVCRVCSGYLSATEQELLFCTGSLFQFSGQQTDSWRSCPNRGRQNPKILNKWFHYHIVCKSKKNQTGTETRKSVVRGRLKSL